MKEFDMVIYRFDDSVDYDFMRATSIDKVMTRAKEIIHQEDEILHILVREVDGTDTQLVYF